MHRGCVAFLAACLVLAGAARAEFSDTAVEEAIERGVKFLWSKQLPAGNWPAHGAYKVGPTAIVCYALLESGVSPQDPRMAKALAWLTRHKTVKTYALGLRCNVWEAANRTTRDKYRKYLARDAKQLWMSATKGAYHYDSDGKRHGDWDNSNTQFALLGMWAAYRNGVEIPSQYWRQALAHWTGCQHPDGQWGYKGGDKRPTMTVGGIASLYICFDPLYALRYVQCRGGVHFKPIKKGLDWLDANFPKTIEGGPKYYYYYGVERVALASGYKYFGKADWYKLGAEKLVRAQEGDGSWPAEWGSKLASTSFALLFLIRGRHAVIFNKLEYDGYWNNRPRDLANLTRWMSRTFERTVNWQIINLKAPVSEWHDAPVLYISGSKAPKFSEDDLSKLRTFVLQGGALFSVSECGQKAFREAMRKTYEKLFPGCKLVECPPEHDLYTRKAHFDVPRGRPKMFVLSNGVRPLAIHTDEDLAKDWQLRRHVTSRASFHMAANVAKYITGSVATLRHRGTTHWPPERKWHPRATLKLARLQHEGQWDPEPLAYVRLGRLVMQDLRLKIEVLSPMPIEKLPASGAKLATLTGTGPLKLADGQVQALKKYVESGGTLLVDAAGGCREFADSARALLRQAFAGKPLRPLSSDFAIYRYPGLELERVVYRARTDERLGRIRVPSLHGILIGGRAAVLFSREDITAGLVGYPSYTVDGYKPRSAYEIVRNIAAHLAIKPPSPEELKKAPRGLIYGYYEGQYGRLPDFDRLKPLAAGTVPRFALDVAKRKENFALRFTGLIDVPAPGEYTFYLKSDDGSRLYINDRRVVDHDGLHADTGEKSGGIRLSAGKHPITVIYFEKGGNEVLRVSWKGPNLAKQEIPPDVLYHRKQDEPQRP